MKTRRSFLFVFCGVLLGLLQIPWRKTVKTVGDVSRISEVESSWPTIPAVPAWCYKIEWLAVTVDRLVTDWETVSHMYRTLPHRLQLRKSYSPWADQTYLELAISHRIYLGHLWVTEVCNLDDPAQIKWAIVTVGAMFKRYRELPNPSTDDLCTLQCLAELQTFLREYDNLQLIGPEGLKEVLVGPTA